MDTLFDIVEETQLMGTPVMDTEAFMQLLIRFFFISFITRRAGGGITISHSP